MVKQVYISRLRQERERRGWSRNYIAEQIEVDVVTVGRWERGERLPHPIYRQKLCDLFEMNALDLGLFSEPSQESNEEGAIADVPSGIQDTKPAAPYEHTLAEKKKLLSASRNVFRERRALLIGIGGFGIATLTGSGLLLASRTPSLTPSVFKHAHISMDKPFQLLFDPNKFNGINRLSWSLDESYIAAATRTNVVSIWNRVKSELLHYHQTPNQWVNDVAWSKTDWIASSSADLHAGSVEIWNLKENKPIVTFQRPHAIRSASWSPDGNYLAFSGHSPTVEVWNPFISRQISQYQYPALGTQYGISRVRWSAQGNLLACAADDGTVHVCEALTGQKKIIYSYHQGRVIDVVWSPDSRYIASAGADKTVRVWEALSGRTVSVYKGHTDQVEGVDWSLQGKYIVSSGKDRTAQVWEALTGKMIISYKKINDIVETTLWSKDGTMFALGTDTKGIEIWKFS
jgi:WD40 repeat protein/transcriptional regulator with XRE-family HTH domain